MSADFYNKKIKMLEDTISTLEQTITSINEIVNFEMTATDPDKTDIDDLNCDKLDLQQMISNYKYLKSSLEVMTVTSSLK